MSQFDCERDVNHGTPGGGLLDSPAMPLRQPVSVSLTAEPGTVRVSIGETHTRAWCIDDLARTLGASRATVYRWAGGANIPRPVQIALVALCGAIIAHRAFAGWWVGEDGKLYPEHGPGRHYGFQAAEIEAWSYVYATNAALFRDRARLRQKAAHAGREGVDSIDRDDHLAVDPLSRDGIGKAPLDVLRVDKAGGGAQDEAGHG